jgi:hypothetical protein
MGGRWLFPRDAVDFLFPGPLWYLCLWIVLCFVAVGWFLYKTVVVCWRVCVWVDRAWLRK